MITKIKIKTNSLEELDRMVAYYQLQYNELIEDEKSTSYTLVVDEDNLELTIKTLTLAESVN